MDLLQNALPEALEELINRLEDPVFLIDQRRTILLRNTAAKSLLKAKAGAQARSGRLTFPTPAANAELEAMLLDCQAASAEKCQSYRGLKLPRRGSTRGWLVMISVLPLAPGPVFLVQLVCRLNARHLPVDALHDLFGLTQKEIDLLARLIRNESLRDIAKHLQLSHETIRAYLKRIFRKCEVQSQSELLALLQRISMFAHWDD